MTIPAFLNPASGSAARARPLLQSDARFVLRELDASAVADAVRAEMNRGTRRILVCGGDGTISAAVSVVAGSPLEVAVFPGGTLNHFARDMGIPLNDPVAALNLAASGIALPTDLGYVNGRAMLNTSSVGAYVDFVRFREASEKHFGYRFASVIAAARVWFRPRLISVDIRADEGSDRSYDTPLLFVGVGERVFEGRALGARRPGGTSALHVVVGKGRVRPRVAARALRALIHGRRGPQDDDVVDVRLVTHLVAASKSSGGMVAVDGELVHMTAPLNYELKRGAVLIARAASS